MKHLLVIATLFLFGCSSNSDQPTAAQTPKAQAHRVAFKPEPKPNMGYTVPGLYGKYFSTKPGASGVWSESINDVEMVIQGGGNVSITGVGSVDVSTLTNESGTFFLVLDGIWVDQRHIANLSEGYVALPPTVVWEGELSPGSHTVRLEQDIAGWALSTPKISVLHF